MRSGKVEFKVRFLNLDESEPPDHPSSKTQTRITSFIIQQHGGA